MTTPPRGLTQPRPRGVRDWHLGRRLLGLPQALWCTLAHRPLQKLQEVQHVRRAPGVGCQRVESWRCRVCGRPFTRVHRLRETPVPFSSH